MIENIPLLLCIFIFLDYIFFHLSLISKWFNNWFYFFFQFRMLEDQYQNHGGYLAWHSKFQWVGWCHCTSKHRKLCCITKSTFKQSSCCSALQGVSSWELRGICGHKIGLRGINSSRAVVWVKNNWNKGAGKAANSSLCEFSMCENTKVKKNPPKIFNKGWEDTRNQNF